MPRKVMTDDEVEEEIKRLLTDDAVRLAKKEQQIKYRRRQFLYTLRSMQKRGEELISSGISMENIEEVLFTNE